MDKLKELLSKDSRYEYENINKNSKQTNASVFLPVLFKNGEYSILLLKRSKNLSAHSDEICLPGGTFEENDFNLLNLSFNSFSIFNICCSGVTILFSKLFKLLFFSNINFL